MKPTMLYHCDHCSKFVETVEHDVLELYDDNTRQAKTELRCSLCTREVTEVFGCVTCKAAEAESGADECTRCLNVSEKPVSNSTPAYLRFHTMMEHDAGLPAGMSVEDILAEGFTSLRFTAHATVDQIAHACAMFSTETHEVVGHVSFVSGKPVVALRRELRPAGLMAVLRPGSDAPLSFLAQRQAS